MPSAAAWHAADAWTALLAHRLTWRAPCNELNGLLSCPACSEYHELEDEFDLNPRAEEAAGGVPHQCCHGMSAGLSWLSQHASSSMPPPRLSLKFL